MGNLTHGHEGLVQRLIFENVVAPTHPDIWPVKYTIFFNIIEILPKIFENLPKCTFCI